ncbi:MAG: pyruvate carboxylase subunit A [Parcubacteria group bacterium CG_4_9_14_0_2_um_filter_35_11]|nr:MAG: pyruvate carboxylase subunit A [Parcubacteria group bacterium CG_4_9_14_0_2_um_filter_35_11]
MEIKKILIANRGEIALRIIRACKEMGIKTVALCPQKGQEEHFLETKLADEFYYLEEEGILGYLDQRKLIEIAKEADVDAIHPGYGFLAENGDFADFCEKNDIKFIGPKGETLRKLGNKLEARKIAQKIGCPLLNGTPRPIQNEIECLKIAKKTDIPFLLKAADGGGGIGIAVIKDRDQEKLLMNFQRIKRMAKTAFGSDMVFFEKCLEKPRHIEFQIVGDGKGKVLHLGERECSVQRRFQKLIEEAPSPFLDKKLRKKMGKFAVKIGEYFNYESLGTVEFLVDSKKNFYFIEVNPRLQVEHPVTELVAGIDLVKEQIKIAQGEKLDLKQRKIKMSNWAMEFRICAEEATEDFGPRTGTVTHYLPPGGKGIEIHSFCHVGQRIFPYFDSLIAKLIIFDKDRQSVISRARRAFDEFIIEGIPTLIPFFKIVLQNKNFIEGNLSTSFIQENNIIEKVREAKAKIKKEVTFKETPEKITKKEIALIVAHFFQEIQETNRKENRINKWKIINRQKFLEEENFR